MDGKANGGTDSSQILFPQTAAAKYVGRSYYWLWRMRRVHPLYHPDNPDAGRGKTAWFCKKRLELIASVEMGELSLDDAYMILERDKAKRRAGYDLALADLDGPAVKDIVVTAGSRRKRTERRG